MARRRCADAQEENDEEGENVSMADRSINSDGESNHADAESGYNSEIKEEICVQLMDMEKEQNSSEASKA
jgi:hypothetical protein